jgi:hypothetical protein
LSSRFKIWDLGLRIWDRNTQVGYTTSHISDPELFGKEHAHYHKSGLFRV